MSKTSRFMCTGLMCIGCTLTTGCVDRMMDGARDAVTTLSEATVESAVILILDQLLPGFIAPPQSRLGLFPV